MKVDIVKTTSAPARGMRKQGSYTTLMRRLQLGETAVITFKDADEARRSQASARQSARKAGIAVQTYRPRLEPHKLCITRMSDASTEKKEKG